MARRIGGRRKLRRRSVHDTQEHKPIGMPKIFSAWLILFLTLVLVALERPAFAHDAPAITPTRLDFDASQAPKRCMSHAENSTHRASCVLRCRCFSRNGPHVGATVRAEGFARVRPDSQCAACSRRNRWCMGSVCVDDIEYTSRHDGSALRFALYCTCCIAAMRWSGHDVFPERTRRDAYHARGKLTPGRGIRDCRSIFDSHRRICPAAVLEANVWP